MILGGYVAQGVKLYLFAFVARATVSIVVIFLLRFLLIDDETLGISDALLTDQMVVEFL